MRHLKRRHLVFALIGLISFIFFVPLTQAQGPNSFGSGIDICTPPIQPVTLANPTTITNCTQAGVQAALDSGGHINFDCGPNPVTIPVNSALNLSTTADTVLDGGGLVTLNGQGSTRILHKDWHDPNTVGTVNVTLQNLRFINGQAPSGGDTGDHSGGAIVAGHPGASLHIINSTFENNATTDITEEDNQGGAIFVHNSYETVIVGSVFEGNLAGSGGAFGGIATGLFVFNSRFGNNQASDTTAGGIVRGYGGAIALDGVTNSYNPNSNKRVHVCGSLFEDNTAIRGGGAIDAVVSDNKGTKATYEKSTFTNNEVLGQNGQFGQGGAIYHIEDDHAGGTNEDNFEVIESTFQGNKAGRQGGAVWVYILGRGEVVNSTFEGNTTTAPFNEVGQGGAMAVTLGTIDITNVTFANNHAAYQGGALHGGGGGNAITLKNTIFYSNTLNEQDQPSPTEWQGYHTNRPMLDGGQNIQHPRLKPTYNNDVNNNITANPIYQDPLLLPLADNGGPNWTMALQAGSPAIDAGAGGCPVTDQRGEAREGACDIGAYEYQASRVAISPAIQTILPGETAVSQVYVQTAPGFTETLDLTMTNPYTTLLSSLSPLTISPNQTATLTLTDTHSGSSLIPGLWYTIPVTATGGGLTLSAEARLLVGGETLYLPVVVK
jgi:predicted outer membrane repeat protein